MTMSLASRLDAMHTLAEISQNGLSIGINSIFMTEDGVLGIANPPRSSLHRFTIDGMQFHVSLVPEDTGTRCQITAEIGHVPYTAESTDRRNVVLTILRATQRLRHARFIVENGQKIHVMTNTYVSGHMTPDALMYETILFVHESRPYLRLLSQYI